MKSQNVEQFLEEAGVRDGKMQEVFTKMSGIWQQHSGMGRKLSSDIITSAIVTSSDVIESVLPEQKHVPINLGKTFISLVSDGVTGVGYLLNNGLADST